MIIDYHAHLPWDRDEDRYLVEDCLEDMDANGIDVRMISALDGYSVREQNAAVQRAVDAHPDRLLGCAVINPRTRDCYEEMERVVSSGAFRAIELDGLEHSYYPETQQKWLDPILELARDNGLVVNCFTGWGPRTMPVQWAFYAKRFPDLPFVMLHMGTTDFGYGCVKMVPEYDNVYVETSCLYEFPIIRRAMAAIDHKKILFGTHYPHKSTHCSLHAFDLLGLDEEFIERHRHLNAKELLGL